METYGENLKYIESQEQFLNKNTFLDKRRNEVGITKDEVWWSALIRDMQWGLGNFRFFGSREGFPYSRLNFCLYF